VVARSSEYVSVVAGLKTRFVRPALLNVRPPGDRRYDERGHCSVCGKDSIFVFNSWVIPADLHAAWNDPAVSLAYTRRESLFCRSCCSSLRVRGVAGVLLSLYGSGAKAVAELVRQDQFRRLDVAEINTIGPLGALHPFLAQLPHLVFSEYRGASPPGEVIDGSRNEDMCRLTYDDQSFDLVLSSDTLEHVPDYLAALRETRRVLRPGGRHVFTVPIFASRPTTETRAEIDSDGEVVHLLPPLFHGRGSGLFRYAPVGQDLLTFTEFGGDLVDRMGEVGFDPEVLRGGDGHDETGAAWVFSGRVPG
jgi:SAM-dependent methyltransferase